MSAVRVLSAVLLVMMPAVLVPRAAHACVTDAECFIFNPCRTNFRCVAGLCQDDPVVCQTQNACTLSHCDLNLGCVYAPACPDDGIVCNGTEYCIVFNNQPSCGRLSLNGCNDGDACTIDYCQEPLGASCSPA